MGGKNPTECPSSDPQENQKDSKLATASSQYFPGAYLKHQNLGALNRTQVGVCLNNLIYQSPTCISPKYGTHLNPKWRSIQSWVDKQSWITWDQKLPFLSSHLIDPRHPWDAKLSTHGPILESQCANETNIHSSVSLLDE